MEIQHIGIENFKGVGKFQMTPAKVNVLIGENGTGKSSILQAIRYGITGNIPADPVAGGQEKGVVELKFPDIGTLRRTVSIGRKETRLNGKITTQKSIDELLEKRTGVSSATANLMTSAETLSGLSSGELSAYFIENNLLNVRVSVKTLLDFCSLSKAGEKLLREKISGDTVSLEEIDQIWNESKTYKKVLSKQLKEARIRSADREIEVKESAEEIERQFMDLMDQQSNLRTEQRNYENVCRKREKTLAEIRQKESQLGEVIPEPDENMLLQVGRELEHMEDEIQNLQGVIAAMKTNGNRLAMILSKLSSSACPISPKLKCETDKTAIKTDLNNEIDQMKKEYDRQKERLAALEKQRNELREKKRTLEEQAKKYQIQKILKEQIEYLRANIPEKPAKPSEEQLKEIAVQAEAINKKRTALIQKMTAEEYWELYREKSGEESAYEEIVHKLDPNRGIRKKILQNSLKPLEDYFNHELQRILPKYRVRLECEKGLSIKLLDGDKVYDASKSASSGERARIWFVLMDLINALSAYRILIFDYTDGMDAKSLINLLDMLSSKELQERYDHIFVSVIDYAEIKEYLTYKEELSVIRVRTENTIRAAA